MGEVEAVGKARSLGGFRNDEEGSPVLPRGELGGESTEKVVAQRERAKDEKNAESCCLDQTLKTPTVGAFQSPEDKIDEAGQWVVALSAIPAKRLRCQHR